MKQAASREQVVSRARELAAAGGHLNYITIETELWNEGYFKRAYGLMTRSWRMWA